MAESKNKIERKVVAVDELNEEDLFFCSDDYEEHKVEFYEDDKEYEQQVIEEPMYELDEKESKTLLEKIILYLASNGFEKSYTKYAEIHNRQKEVIRDTFCKKILRRIGEALDITISVSYDICGFLIRLLNRILNSAVEIICGVAYKLIGLFIKIPGC